MHFHKFLVMTSFKNIKAFGATSATEPLVELTIPRRELQPQDVQFEVLYCGICHSDLHSVRNDWGRTNYPLVPGHEILGRVSAVGSGVTKFKVGDLVGVGCIVDSCRQCDYCAESLEQYCDQGATMSYNSPEKFIGGMTYGGFSKTYVCDENYVLRMPAFENLAAAAPLLCAGITVYSPLKYWNVGPGQKVGVLGIGGLGHMAIKIAKAMGAEVVVLTSSPSKVEDAKRLGADHAILTSDAEEMKCYKRQFNLIVDTVSAKHNVNTFLGLLKPEGTVVLVGLPSEPLDVSAFSIVSGRRSLSGSNIGGIAETQEMLDFCYQHNITADSEIISIQQVNEAFERMEKGDVKYRFVIDMSTL